MAISHSKNSPAWTQGLKPQPDWAIENSDVSEEGWEVCVRWWGSASDDAPAQGPKEVIIRPTSELTPEALKRGITAGVMRNLVPIAGALIGQVGETESEAKFRATIKTLASELPRTPREAPDVYYAGLLRIFEILDAVSTEPINELVRAIGGDISKDTVKTRLRTARQRAARQP
ncbi:hypothetical protein SAMN05892883_2048 [Jatrophihabitans sp. GAS493]|uniref:hypothetical protein n=1 Tax=Jatrophihabitans sp. GAS493 TaxID=1907575 RepID=UPI000BB80408|nr:hypothetical protein [Jatrophihabitans sp. GAS493]SOD72695.1 hypothetical protein SAMN05892883_2048 [Jatrophihabitans sp. GAS493]